MNLPSPARARRVPLPIRAVLVAGLAPSVAGASTITSLTLQNTDQMVTTSTASAYTTDLYLATAGTLTITVSDQLFSGALASLDVSLLDATGGKTRNVSGVLSALNTNGGHSVQDYTWSFHVGPGSYTTIFSAAARSGNPEFESEPSFALGLYDDTVTFTPQTSAVPLPPASGVLATGIAGLGLLARRGRGRRWLASLAAGRHAASVLMLGTAIRALEYCI